MHLCRLASGRKRHTLVLAALCVATACCTSAGAMGRVKLHKENRRSESHQIELMEEEWRGALMKNDASAIDKMTTDDFLAISSNGTLSDKQQYLHRISSHVNEFSTFELMVLKVRVQPGSAIATSQTHIVGTLDGRPVDAVFRYTKVYTRTPGGPWRIANFEATRVSQPQVGDAGMNGGMPLSANPAPPQHHWR